MVSKFPDTCYLCSHSLVFSLLSLFDGTLVGEGLETTFSTFYKDTTIDEVDYCAYVQLRREVSSKDGDVETGEYEVSQTGIRFSHDPVVNQTMDSYQHVFVMLHGDRLDNVDPLWAATAGRPWDPPLFLNGMIRAFKTCQRIRSQTGVPIHRVFVSPFLRCIQTASKVVAALSLFAPRDLPSIDKSKLVKVRSSAYCLNSAEMFFFILNTRKFGAATRSL